MTDRKKILITGAASGIGKETALFFAQQNWFVGLLDINAAGLASLQDQIGYENCFAGIVDVTSAKDVEQTFGNFAQKTGNQLDALFNNAGILKFGRFEEVPIESSLHVVDVNLKGILNCTYHAIQMLKRSSSPVIVNMASTSAIYGVPELAAYSSSKHAVCSITESLDIELEAYGIKVCDILAPYVKTPLLDGGDEVYSVKKMGIGLTPDVIAKTVWKAVHGNKLHWKVGASTHLLFILFWLLPFLRRSIVKKLTICPNG